MASRLSVSTYSSNLALTISDDGAQTRHASQWLDIACRQHDVPRISAERLEICLNEILANIIAHGGSAALSTPVGLVFEVTRDHEFVKARVTVSDAGKPFNPLAAPEKTLPKTLAEAPVGGLGLVMLRRCADWLDYHHEDGRNHLTFGARWNTQ